MKQKLFTACLLVSLCFASAPSLSAQAKKGTAQRQAAASTPTAEQLIQDYRFDDAARALQRDIAAARKAGHSTVRLEADLTRANLGADMLRGVEKVAFVDSFKVSRARMLEALRLSPEAGTLQTTQSEQGRIDNAPKVMGQTAYVNELRARIFFAATDSVNGAKTIWSAYSSGKRWIQAQPLDGLGGTGEDQDYPFVMPDGVTLYYAAQGDGSLGGYDLFVTRYDTETKRFLKAENLGMPFNSPANDYLLAIDEGARLGWLVTDRGQQADSVCIYTFIPTDTRDVYELSDDNRAEVLAAARISVKNQPADYAGQIAEARQRLAQATTRPKGATARPMRFVINDQTVYTSLDQFKSDAARRIAMQVSETQTKLDEALQRSDELQRDIAAGRQATKARAELRTLTPSIATLQQQLHTLAKNMRQAELK